MTDGHSKYIRKVQTSVTNFLFCGEEYLFIKRNLHRRIDPGRLNGIGGRLEPGEDYLTAAIRETQEETGLIVSPEQVSLSGIVKLEGGYQEDWVMAFFKIEVSSKELPRGTENEEGEFLWLHHDSVLSSQYELVDDLNYCWKAIVEGKEIFFITAQLNDDHKIQKMSTGKLSVKNQA